MSDFVLYFVGPVFVIAGFLAVLAAAVVFAAAVIDEVAHAIRLLLARARYELAWLRVHRHGGER